MTEDIDAIKTTYSGQTFKSRLEANMAYVLDEIGYEWIYEPESFLLDNGEHYQPDFYVPELNLWVETRGYRNEKGKKQIKGFAEKLEEKKEDEYLVLKHEGCQFLGKIWDEGLDTAYLSKCEECRRYFFHGLSGSYRCRNCGVKDGDHHLGKGGKLIVGKDSEIYLQGGSVGDYTKAKRYLERW